MLTNKAFAPKVIRTLLSYLLVTILGLIAGTFIVHRISPANLPNITIYSSQGLIEVPPTRYCDIYIPLKKVLQKETLNCVKPSGNSTTGYLNPNSEVTFSLPTNLAKNFWGYCIEKFNRQTKRLSHYCAYPSAIEKKSHRIMVKNKLVKNWEIATIEINFPVFSTVLGKIQPLIDRNNNLTIGRVWVFHNSAVPLIK